MEMKRNIIAVLAIVMVLCCVTLAACNNKTNVLDNYIFEMDGTTVSADFTLPSTIGGEKANWTSDKDNVRLEKRESDWLAKVTLPKEGSVEVKLTVSVKKASKSYTVRVKALDVYDFMNNYVFPKNKATIVDNFDLETEFTYKGEKATIAWSVAEQYELYIKVIEDGKKLQVTPQSKQTPVDIKATFTYKGVSSSQNYHMTVYKTLEGMELVNYWYNNTPVSVDMSGYVVSIARNFDEKFGNVSFYMVNDDFSAGYYIYNVNSNAEQSAQLAPGVHVTVTGTTNQNYNGLVETNAGGKLVVDDDKPAINVAEKVRALDEEVLGDLPSTVYSESRLVSLSNWSVKSVATPNIGDKKYVSLTIEKGGKTVDVVVSKYMEGAYAPKEGDATFDALCALGKTFTVGKTVNVTGILSKFGKNWQIMPLSANAVAESGKDADPADKKDYVGMQIATAMGKVNAQLLKDGIVDKDGKTVRITNPADFTLLNKDGNVTVAYQVVGTSNAVVFDQNKMTVTPGNPETTTVLATYKLGDYEAIQFIYVESLIPTAASMLDDLKVTERIGEETKLPVAPADATLTWEVAEDSSEFVQIKDGKLIPAIVNNDTLVMLKATITYKGITRTKDFVVIIQAPKTFIKLALDAANALEDKKTTEQSHILIGKVTEITDPYSEEHKNVTFKISDGKFEVLIFRYNLADAKDIKVGDSIALAAPMKKFGSTLEAVAKFVKLNVTDMAVAYQAGADKTGVDGTTVYGRITKIGTKYSAEKNSISLTITDGTTSMDCYSMTGGADLKVGDYILVTGKPDNYKGTVQFAKGATYVSDGIYVSEPTLVPEIATTMKAGTYKFTMDTTPKGGKVLYATGEIDDKGALKTTEDATKAADFVVAAVAGKENVYTIKFGDKYLVGYLNGTFNNMKLDATPGEWTWDDTVKAFTCTFKDKDGNDSTFYFGAFFNSKYNSVGKTMSLSKLSFITGDKAANIGKTQFVGYACTLKAAE